MGTPVVGQFTGETNGSVTTFNYTSDFTTLNGHLADLNTKLNTLNIAMDKIAVALATTIPSTLEITLGSIGTFEPGTVSNSASLSKDVLTVIAEALLNMQEAQGEITDSIGQMTFAMSGLSSATQESVAVQQMALADQVSTNEFQKTATKDALQRNGIDPPQPRPIADVIREKIGEATTINATTEATTFVTDKLNKGFQYASDTAIGYVTESQAGQWITKKWEAIKSSLLTDPEKVQEKTYKQTISSTMATIRGGAKGTIPPAP